MGPDKGKEKIESSRSASKASSDTEVSYEDTTPLVRRMRLVHSDVSTAYGLLLSGQQAMKQALTTQPIPKAVALTMPGRSSGSISIATVEEVTAAAVATVAKKAADMAATKEAAAKDKATTEEVVVVKKVVEEAEVVKAAKEAVTAKVAEEVMAAKRATTVKAAEEAVAVAGPDGSGDGGPDVM
jgi:hypothetical protein